MGKKVYEGKKKEKIASVERRREMKKISMRKAREKQRNDPIKYEEETAKERKRYHDRKQLINKLPGRQQRAVRK